MSYSFWDGVGDFLTGGTTSIVRGATGKNALAQADPLHLFTDSESDKLAKKTFDAQQYWNLANYNEQKRQYDENLKFQQEAYNYQQSLNALQMEREDTAVQRRVADLEAAGLSPTLAAGSSASATPVHAANAPQGTPAQMSLPSDIRVQQAMFKEGLMRDQMQLALSVLGNIADVSRTKAETEFINAQKERYIAETPTDLRIKEELAELNEQLHSIRIDQAKQDLTNSEADYINKLWDHVAASDDHILKTTKAVREELGVKLDEQALRIGQSEENIKKTEALIKGFALQLEQYKLDTEKSLQDFYENLGVPRGMHDKPTYAPFTLIRGLIEGLDKGGTYLWDKASSGLKKLPRIKSPKEQGFISSTLR